MAGASAPRGRSDAFMTEVARSKQDGLFGLASSADLSVPSQCVLAPPQLLYHSDKATLQSSVILSVLFTLPILYW
jgi:hypothetical protein